MAPDCNHDCLQCVHRVHWRRQSWTPDALSQVCHEYESVKERHRKAMEYHGLLHLQTTDDGDEYDPDEAEKAMDSMPSPQQQCMFFWTPEYEARRQARGRLWSPPMTPNPGEHWASSYSLQPSQRPPTPSSILRRRRRRRSSQPTQAVPLVPAQAPHPVTLYLPQKTQSKVRKSKKPRTSRRPTTRSMKALQEVALDSKRGYIVVQSDKSGRIVSFGEFMDGIIQGP